MRSYQWAAALSFMAAVLAIAVEFGYAGSAIVGGLTASDLGVLSIVALVFACGLYATAKRGAREA
jgi:hypothetical protein